VKWTCSSQRTIVLHLFTFAALAMIACGAVLAWYALTKTPPTARTDGGRPIERSRFLAVLGLAGSALFATLGIATAIPRWVLDACQ
jgi:hypothetical protein